MRFKTQASSLSCYLLSATVLFASCKKEDSATPTTPTTPTPTNTTPSTTPVPVGADGALFAVTTTSTQVIPGVGSFEIPVDATVAAFWNTGGAAHVNAGTVKMNGTALTFSNDNYLGTGNDFSAGCTWEISGGNGIPAFTRNITSIPMPQVDSVTSATTLPRNADYTLSALSVNGADSVYFVLGSLLKRKGANASSCTFTAAELGTLTAGSSIVEVVGFNYYSEVIGGKTIYFGKEGVRTHSITLQ